MPHQVLGMPRVNLRHSVQLQLQVQLQEQLQRAVCRWRTFKGLSHEKGQEAKLQLSQKLIITAAVVLLQNLVQHGCLV